MNWRRLADISVVGTVVFTAVACQDSSRTRVQSDTATQANTPLPGTLARAKLAEAQVAAKKWRPDAVLIQVAGSGVKDDGTAPVWTYGFYSAAARTCLVVRPVGNYDNSTESGGETCRSPELRDFIDSDQAMQIARRSGIQKQDVNLVVTVSSTSKGDQAVWTIIEEGMRNPGDKMLNLDAQTGEVLGNIRNP